MNAAVHAGMRASALRPVAPATVARGAFAIDVLEGLALPRKQIAPHWLHDERGARLLERVAQTDDHYLARSEQALIERARPHIAKACGPRATLFELGAGAPAGTQRLLAALDAPAACVRLDLDPDHWPRLPSQGGPRLVYFAGPTIGHLATRDAMALLERLGRTLGRGTLLAVGADSTQDPALLLPAYDDRDGLSAAFNLNLLVRINRELDGDFELSDFEHQARWDAAERRIEMHLVARQALSVQVLGRSFGFAAGESIRTVGCHQHTLLTFRALARHAGWAHRDFWMDPVACYALHLFEFA